MILRIIIPCVAVFLSAQLFGQGYTERLAYKKIQKEKWAMAYDQLTKAMGKDSANVAAAYRLAQYFFAPKNPDFQLDSAYYYAQKALGDFQYTTPKQRVRLRRALIDSLALVLLRQQVDSAAFFRAKRINTESAFNDFIADYPASAQRDAALAFRNEAAYQDALVENTYQAFDSFMIKYPQAARMEDAKSKYDALLFQAKTVDGRLSSYELYREEHPNSPYQTAVEQAIFEIRTAAGTKESYATFLDLYPGSSFSKRAQNILFYLVTEDPQEEQFSRYLDNDSLRNAISLQRGYIVPFLHNGKFGFMNQNGLEVIQVDSAEIDPAYQCGNIRDDVIVLSNKLVAPNGNLIYRGTVNSVEDLGYGFIIIEEGSCKRVMHKTGFRIATGCIEDAKVLNGKFLALRMDRLWSIWTFAGRMLVPFEWDDISAQRDVIMLKKNDKFALTTARAVALLADKQELVLLDFADDVKVWSNDFLWIRKNDRQGILSLALDTLVKVDMQSLSPAYFGAKSIASTGARTYNDKGEESAPFQQIEIRQPWTAVKIDSTWRLFDPEARNFQSPGYDSIAFEGPFAIGIRKDSVCVYFSVRKFLTVPQPAHVAFVPGQDSSSFLLLEQDKKNIYTLDGRRLFTTAYDRVQYAGEGIFLVTKKGKKGLITAKGKPLLPLAYDAIGSVNNGIVSLLNRTKFGLFDCARKKLIKPQYDKNLTCYNDKTNVVYKDGFYGFAGWDNKAIGKAAFDEVQYWNDSAAFVRKDLEWMIYEIKTQKVLLDGIKEYKLIQDDDTKLAIVQQGRNYGVMHNGKGTIIPISFSDIINVGSREEPLYFTEKHVEEAFIFVVIYYDSSGKMLRKEVYEQEDYEKVYCSNN